MCVCVCAHILDPVDITEEHKRGPTQRKRDWRTKQEPRPEKRRGNQGQSEWPADTGTTVGPYGCDPAVCYSASCSVCVCVCVTRTVPQLIVWSSAVKSAAWRENKMPFSISLLTCMLAPSWRFDTQMHWCVITHTHTHIHARFSFSAWTPEPLLRGPIFSFLQCHWDALQEPGVGAAFKQYHSENMFLFHSNTLSTLFSVASNTQKSRFRWVSGSCGSLTLLSQFPSGWWFWQFSLGFCCWHFLSSSCTRWGGGASD